MKNNYSYFVSIFRALVVIMNLRLQAMPFLVRVWLRLRAAEYTQLGTCQCRGASCSCLEHSSNYVPCPKNTRAYSMQQRSVCNIGSAHCQFTTGARGVRVHSVQLFRSLQLIVQMVTGRAARVPGRAWPGTDLKIQARGLTDSNGP